MSVVGRWRIVDMELWDQDAVDLVALGFIEFETESMGSFGFIAVKGGMDWREAPREGRPGVEFTWEGFDEGDPVSGRGWSTLEPDGSLRGHLYVHLGDDSGSHAARLPSRPHWQHGRHLRAGRCRTTVSASWLPTSARVPAEPRCCRKPPFGPVSRRRPRRGLLPPAPGRRSDGVRTRS